jgi:hypothetical protein
MKIGRNNRDTEDFSVSWHTNTMTKLLSESYSDASLATNPARTFILEMKSPEL